MLLTACLILGVLAAEPQPGLPDGTGGQEMLTVPAANQHDLRNPQQVILDRINEDRNRAGLKPLTWDARMADAARDHAELMAEEGRLSHQFDGEPALLERLTRRSVRLDAASENVVYDVTPEGAHEAFVKSPLHRANMMSPAYDVVGISVLNRDGILYVVEDFAHRLFDDSDEAAASRIAEHFRGARQQFGLNRMELVSNPDVSPLVEQMASRETPDSHAPLNLPGVRYAASYATTSPNEMPPSVAQMAAMRGAGSFSVAVRFLRTPRYPSGLFWVSIVMYEGNATLARRW